MRKLLQRLGLRPNYFKDSKQVIEYAFTCGGTDYYQHTDEMNMPYRRALTALTYYTEMDSRIDRAYLEAHIRAMDELLSRRIDLKVMAEILRLNRQMKERMDIVVIPDHVYKLASVRFFDRNENPNDYDFKYNERKIRHWKENEEAAAFFLKEPIGRLVPFLKSAPVDLELYLKEAEGLARAQLENLLAILPQVQRQGLLNSIPDLSLTETHRGKAA